MFIDFWSHLQMSLNCSCSLPTGRFPSASSLVECHLGLVPPPFYKHAPAITGVPVSIESTCLADFLSQEPQRWELCFARRCSKCVWGWTGDRCWVCAHAVRVAPKTRFHAEVCSARTLCILESWCFLCVFHSSKLSLSGWTWWSMPCQSFCWALCRGTVCRRLWILGTRNHGPLQVDDWRLLSQVGQKLLGQSLEGVSNGLIQFKSARKIWPLLELLAKIIRVLACSCSQNFCNCSHARILVNMCSIARNFVLCSYFYT